MWDHAAKCFDEDKVRARRAGNELDTPVNARSGRIDAAFAQQDGANVSYSNRLLTPLETRCVPLKLVLRKWLTYWKR